MKASLTSKMAAVILVTILATGGAAYWSASMLIQQLTMLSQDNHTDQALMTGRQSLFQLHKTRRELAERAIRSCIVSQSMDACVVQGSEVSLAPARQTPADEATSWIDETTVVLQVGNQWWRAVIGWPTLRPQFEEISEILRTRSHLVDLSPRLSGSFRAVFGLSIMAAGSLGLVLAFILARNIRKRVASLTAYAERLATGQLEAAPLDTRGADEVGILAEAMARMASDLDAVKNRLIYAEKINSWQAIAKKVAHEIKNPLTPISLVADHMERFSREAPETMALALHESSRILREEIGALDRMVREFGSFARLPAPQLANEELGQLVDDFVARNPHSGHQTLIFARPATMYPVQVDKHMLFQVLHNLINNARLACDHRPVAVQFSLRKIDDQHCELIATDNGPGVPEAVRDTLFDAYVTTRSTGDRERGMGLGLAISRKIAEDHKGALYLKESGPTGSQFALRLPLRKEA